MCKIFIQLVQSFAFLRTHIYLRFLRSQNVTTAKGPDIDSSADVILEKCMQTSQVPNLSHSEFDRASPAESTRPFVSFCPMEKDDDQGM